MSVGLFAAGTRDDLKRLARALRSGAPTGGAELQRMALIDLATLCDCLFPSKPGVDVLSAAVSVSGGTALVLPEEVRDRLASLRDDELPSSALQWSKCEEFRGLMQPQHLEAFLREVRTVAVAARTAGQPLVFLNV